MRSFLSVMFAISLLLISTACGRDVPEGEHENFNPANFSDPTRIDNKWLPLKPGMQYVYEGFTNDDNGDRVPRRLVSTITDLTKVIDGVRTVVAWDRDYNADELVEAELAFYAEDNDGTVWRMGEYPEEYKDGNFVDAPTWLSGIEGAVAGIEMLGEPEVGDPSYSQGWSPKVDFTDRGQVTQTGQSACVPAGCFDNLLVISETSQAEPDAVQLKYYAPGIGNVQVSWQGSDNARETLELTQVIELSQEARADARASVLALAKSAYEHSKDVYAVTMPEE